MNKKYELLKDDAIIINGKTLYRIRALRTSIIVRKGNLGGYIESEDNLSHEDLCWVGGDAKVYGNAKVYENAFITNNVEVYDNAMVHGRTFLSDNVKIYDNAEVCGSSVVYNNAMVFDRAKVYDNAEIFGNAKILGDSEINTNAQIGTNAKILNSDDYIIFKGFGFEATTLYKCENNVINVMNRCFTGTEEKFRNTIKNTNKNYYVAYSKFIDVIYTYFGLDKEVEKDE